MKEDAMKKFAQLLGNYIETSGMKQTHVASTAGISYNYLQRLIAGDRNPSGQVVDRLAQALHLSSAQTGELLASAGFAPPLALLQPSNDQEQKEDALTLSGAKIDLAIRMAQDFYKLAQEVPEPQKDAFLDEMKHLLGYARYKYILTGGRNTLDLNPNAYKKALVDQPEEDAVGKSPYLNLLAQIVGELHSELPEETTPDTGDVYQPSQPVDEILTAIDRLTGKILSGDMSGSGYQPHLIVQTLDMLREGAPWEIRRRIAEALPGLCRLDVAGAEHLMEILRLDIDEVRKADIRRRVIEALPGLFATSLHSLPTVIRLLRPRAGDDIYVALATVEVCGDIQATIKQMFEKGLDSLEDSDDASEKGVLEALIRQGRTEISKLQRQLPGNWEGVALETLQFSMALHNLVCAPDTLLISLREGLQSSEMLMQVVAARYLERILPVRPTETLELYRTLLQTTTRRNVRRTVAKALPTLLQCLREASLSIRALARSIMSDLAVDPDIYIRRAVADHAMQIFHIDREFLLILLRTMHKDTDRAIRHRLQPVALCLAQVWLVWYAETAGLVDTKRNRNNAISPFGE